MHIKSSLTQPTVRRRKAKRNRKKTVQPPVLVLNGENGRRKAKAFRIFPPVSYARAKTVVERERNKATRKHHEMFRRSPRAGENGRKRAKKRTTKRYEPFHRSLREGENGRKRTQEQATQKRVGKGVSLCLLYTSPSPRD